MAKVLPVPALASTSVTPGSSATSSASKGSSGCGQHVRPLSFDSKRNHGSNSVRASDSNSSHTLDHGVDTTKAEFDVDVFAVAALARSRRFAVKLLGGGSLADL
jgi:hypothetical protein